MGGVYIGEGRVELNLVVRGDMEEGTCALEKKVKKKWIPSPPQRAGYWAHCILSVLRRGYHEGTTTFTHCRWVEEKGKECPK